MLPPPNLAAVIKASRFVGVEELAKVFKVQTGHTVAAQQLEILSMKTAEFRVISGTRLMSMVYTGVMYNVQYEFGWALVDLPRKVRDWRDQARAQEEAEQLSAPAGAKLGTVSPNERQEEAGQQSTLANKVWKEADITVEDVEMVIEAEEQKTRK